MRLFVHGMQSSGATAFTLFLAQRPDCLALVDIPNNFAAPRIGRVLTKDMVVKAVITTAYPAAVHIERFRPDRTILFLRDPRDNYQSLSSKTYRNYSGLMDEKFVLLDQVFAERSSFDAVIHYEDFVARSPQIIDTVNALGWRIDSQHYTYARRHDELFAALLEDLPDLYQSMEMVFGNVRGKEVDARFRDKPHDEDLERRLSDLCPRLLDHYKKRTIP
jgi:hypothetical protein